MLDDHEAIADEVDRLLTGLVNKPGVDRALIANLLGYTVQSPGEAVETGNKATHYELDPCYVGES